MFSVVIPLFNKQLSVRNTVMSVMNQSFKDFEVIIIDDGSTDDSLNVVKKIIDPRIRIIEKPNGGVSSSRNRGIESAKYNWIAFLDGDDLWEYNHLETISKMIAIYTKDKVFCSSFVRSDLSVGETNSNEITVIEDYFVEAQKNHFFWTSIAVVKREVFNDVGMFREEISRGEDLDLWARIGRKYRFVKSSVVTGIYVQDSENKITKTKLKYVETLFNDLHKRTTEFVRSSEKQYYLTILLRAAKTFFSRKEFKNGFKTLYRFWKLYTIKVQS